MSMAISDRLLDRLRDPSLVIDKAFIGGEWISKSDSGKTFDITNPANGEVIATVPDRVAPGVIEGWASTSRRRKA